MKIRLGLEFSIKREPPTAAEILEVLSDSGLALEEEDEEPTAVVVEREKYPVGFQPNWGDEEQK